MATVNDALNSQIKNIEEKYGKSLDEWLRIIKDSGLTKHPEIVTMLKTKYGMTHGNAHRLSLVARGTDAGSINKSAELKNQDPIALQYTGAKAALKPLYDKLLKRVQEFGNDIELAPKSTYVSLRHRKQFAMIQPSSATRLDVGLVLKDQAVTHRLESAKTFNALFTHRVRLTSENEIDSQLISWLKEAYNQAE